MLHKEWSLCSWRDILQGSRKPRASQFPSSGQHGSFSEQLGEGYQDRQKAVRHQLCVGGENSLPLSRLSLKFKPRPLIPTTQRESDLGWSLSGFFFILIFQKG